MDVFTAIDGRVTARVLGPPGPTADAIQRIVHAGVQAPDHGRLAPWRFAVMAGHDRALLGDALAGRRQRRDPACTQDALEAERAKAMRAPLIIAVAAHVTPDHKVPAIEQIMAVAACVQNMILAARALGFAANWKTGSAAHDATVAQAIGFAADDQIVALLYLGTKLSDDIPREVTIEGTMVRPPIDH